MQDNHRPGNIDKRIAVPRLRVAIIGGGIGGIALAIALSRRTDIELSLFEAASAFSEIGAGVSFGANAVAAIRHLGLEAAYRRVADGSPAPDEDVWFEWRRARDAGYLGVTRSPGCGQSSVHRADFLDAMVACLPDGIAQFGKRCCGVSQGNGQPEAVFEDDSRITADVIIGADGIKSVVRAHVLPSAEGVDIAPRFCGTYAYRGLIEQAALAERLAGIGADARLVCLPQMYLGTDRHVLTFPVKKGQIINVVAFVTDPQRVRPTTAITTSWVEAVSRAELQQAFSDHGAAVHAVLEGIEAPTRWAMHDLPVLPRYHRRQVVIMGDAAHATLPHQGAGAGQALEDALVLAGLLGDPRCDRSRVIDVLAAFDAVRRSRAGRVQTTSYAMGERYQGRVPNRGDDNARLAADLETRFDWIWNFDPAQSVVEARTLLGWHDTSA